LIEDKLRGNPPEKKATHRRERRKEEFKRKSSWNETSESSGDEKCQKRKEDARNIIAQARVNNSRYAWREENYEDDEKEMGALCLTRRVRKTRVPKGFKLPHDQEKYDGCSALPYQKTELLCIYAIPWISRYHHSRK
jgi:hypothetical protein